MRGYVMKRLDNTWNNNVHVNNYLDILRLDYTLCKI